MSKHRMKRSKVPVKTVIKYWRYRLELVLIRLMRRYQ